MTPKKKVYLFFVIIIAICFTILLAFHLSLFLRAVLCTLIFFCSAVMRSVHKATTISSDNAQEEPSFEKNIVDVKGKKKQTNAVDAYLQLLRERDKSMADNNNDCKDSDDTDHPDR